MYLKYIFCGEVFPTNLSHKEIIYNPSSVQMHTLATRYILVLEKVPSEGS